ncbi:MAG TPA: tripartite tricarboxylate transporter substrate binding protein, partial [Usitatibacter sp.]|nr:tripartite tricarboxylate transporter substrate binding protein [Usitatibacter sp.]
MLRRMLATVVLAAAAAGAMAQDYPTKPIKLIVPFPPGGGTDIMSRVVGQKLGDMNKWTIVVDNRPGAGGNIGVEAATRSAPDGYTLVMGQTSNLAINPSLFKALPYDPLKDLVPIVLVGEGPIAIAVRAESPYKTLADLVEAAKAKPGAVTMATPGNGTVAHLSGVRLMQATGAKFEHIPYKGASAAIPDLLGGNVDFYL